MSRIINQKYLTSRMLIVFAVSLSCLVGMLAVCGTLVGQIERSSQFAYAFRHLVDNLNEIERDSLKLKNADWPQARQLDDKLLAAYYEVAAIHGALQAVDPDGAESDSDDVDAVSDVVDRLLIAEAVVRNRLPQGKMPDALIEIWEYRAGGEPRLEGLVSELLLAMRPASGGGFSSVSVRVDPRAAELLSRIVALLPAVTVAEDTAIRENVSRLNLALVAIGIFGLLTGIAIWLGFIRPTIRAVAESHNEIVAERDRALQAEQAKGEFLAVMSHELRTPMNGVIGFANLLGQSSLNGLQREFVETIQKSGETLLTLLNDILDFSKIEAGKIELEEEDFAIEDVLDSILDLLGPGAYTKNLELSSFTDPTMPAHLVGDQARLRQILFNLVGNAVKFTHAGAVSIEIHRNGEDRYEIAVADTGIGIPEDKLDEIFERFTQADTSTSRRFGGTGLGLAISRRLAELMGGTLVAESSPGEGSVFRLRLPLRQTRPPVGTLVERANGDIRGRRVLVVDDNDVNRRIFMLMLEAYGALPESVPDGHAAMSALLAAAGKGHAFEVVVIDHMMPVIDGFQLAAMIRQEPSLSGIRLVLSSSAHLASGSEREITGFDAQCPKPVRQGALLAAIDAVLRTAPVSDSAEHGISDGGTGSSEASTGAADDAAIKRGAVRLLVAEDNSTNRRLLAAILAGHDYAVDMVSNGAEAVHQARTLPYDIMLFDVNMPEMGGVEATERIRAGHGRNADTPIIAITANAMKGDREKYLAAGMNDYVSKPIKAEELLAKLHRWTRSDLGASVQCGS